MVKKLITLLMAVVLAIGMSSVAMAATFEEDCAAGRHFYEPVATGNKEANCTSGKQYYYECRYCDAYKYEEVGAKAPKNHVGGETTATYDGDCSKDGYIEYRCGGCGELLRTEVTGKNPEKHVGGTYTAEFDGNCKDAGHIDTYCGGCTALLSSETTETDPDNHNFVEGMCMRCGAKEPTEECEHEDAEVIELYAGDCKVPKQEFVVCECGYTETIVYDVDPEAHIYEDGKCAVCGAEEPSEECDHEDAEVFELYAGDCKVPKQEFVVCECGYTETVVYDVDPEAHIYEDGKCAVCGAEEPSDECKHNYQVLGHVEPTCELDGSDVYVCLNCKDEYTVELEALGHKMIEGAHVYPTCTLDGCIVYMCANGCGKEETELLLATGHQDLEFGHDKKFHWVYCDDCDTVLAEGKHEMVKWTKNGVVHHECKICDFGFTKKVPTQQGQLDGVPKTGDR